jgi:dihydrofolate synthase/folylpolyglutamate synthase
MNYPEALDFLFQQLPMYQRVGKAAFKKDLSNTIALCKHLGEPQKQFKSIHIAGTNGKGSVSHILAAIFQTAGYKTGLYTSPHLKDFRERIRVNGEMIPQKKVIDFIETNKRAFSDISPSFFEWTVALAFDHFAGEKVDIAIIETGLGGRLDSTNVILPELSIITNIGLDHTDFLGDNLTAIAKEKAGIIKKQKPVILGNTSGEKAIFKEKAHECQSKIYFAEEYEYNFELQSDLKGFYQKENIKTVTTAWFVLRKLGWKISFPHFKKGLLNVVKLTGLQGRWQELKSNPKVIVDTAHNREGFQYIWQQLSKEQFNQLHMVLGFVKEKSLEELLKGFPKDAIYYFCQAEIPRAMDKNLLQEKAREVGLIGNCYNTVKEAYSEALNAAHNNDFIYIGGSNFVVAEIL